MYAVWKASDNLDSSTKKEPVAQPTANRSLMTAATSEFRKPADIKTEDEANEVVRKCWQIIEAQCRSSRAGIRTAKSLTRDFPTVRVFVSSTFTDFNSERDILVKKVFPKLRDWCYNNGISLIETDLRWGIPKDTAASETISICLNELKNCYEINNGRPFFINLLGDRYGWIPGEADVPPEVQQQFDWVPNLAITHMEILCGAYRTANPNAAFFLRTFDNPRWLDDVPKEFYPRFTDVDLVAKVHMKVMKEKLRQKFKDTFFSYKATYGGLENSTGRDNVKITDLGDVAELTVDSDAGEAIADSDTFAEKVFKFLRQAIRREYIDKSKALKAPRDRDDFVNCFFADQVASNFTGRSLELRCLHQYISKPNADLTSPPLPITVEKLRMTMPCRQNAEKNEAESDDGPVDICATPDSDFFGPCPWAETAEARKRCNRIFWITGKNGVGKTALLAKFTRDVKRAQPKMKIFCNFPTASSRSRSTSLLLIRVLNFCGIKPETDETDPEGRDYKKFDQNLRLCQTEGWQALWKNSSETYLFVLDSFTEIENQNCRFMSFLPPMFPPNVFCIVCCEMGDQQAAGRIESRGPYKLLISNLQRYDQANFVKSYLASYNKALDDKQMDLLLKEERLALWLEFAAEELRIFGDFRTLNQRIESFPSSVRDLIANILKRMDTEDETKMIFKACLPDATTLCFLCCSRQLEGYNETVLKYVLGNAEKKEPISDVHFATIRGRLGKLACYQDEKLSFMNWLVANVAKKYCFENNDNATYYHRQLAIFFDKICSRGRLTLDELPRHLARSGQGNALIEFLFFDQRSMMSTPFSRQQAFNEIRCPNITSASMGTPSATASAICTKCESRNINRNPRTCFVCSLSSVQYPGVLCATHKLSSDVINKCYICASILNVNCLKKITFCSVCVNYGTRCCYLKRS